MKKISIFLLAILMASVFGAGLAGAEENDAQKAEMKTEASQPKEIVATVNGEPISATDLAITVDQMKRYRQYQEHTTGRTLPPMSEEEYQQEAMQSLIFLELAYQDGKKSVTIDPADIDARLEEIKAKYPSEEAFQEAMQQQNTNEEKLRGQIERQMIIQKTITREVMDKAVVDEEAARKQMEEEPERFSTPEQVIADAVFVPIEIGAHKRAEGIIAELKEKGGVDELSDTEGLRINRNATISAELDEKIFKELEGLKAGDVSDVVIVDKSGMHVFRILERKPAKRVSYEEAEPWFLEQAKAKLGREWDEKLHQGAEIEILLESAKPAEETPTAPESADGGQQPKE